MWILTFSAKSRICQYLVTVAVIATFLGSVHDKNLSPKYQQQREYLFGHSTVAVVSCTNRVKRYSQSNGFFLFPCCVERQLLHLMCFSCLFQCYCPYVLCCVIQTRMTLQFQIQHSCTRMTKKSQYAHTPKVYSFGFIWNSILPSSSLSSDTTKQQKNGPKSMPCNKNKVAF